MPNNRDLLRRVIEVSGLSARRFATLIAWRDERTIRRWLAGEPVPAVVEARLRAIDEMPRRHLMELVRLAGGD
jgi:hypothetical protein